MLAKIGASLLGRGNVEQKPSKGHLDLDLSSDPELSAAFEAAVAEGGRDSLCAVLRRCAERPSALSIARTDDETGPRLLPHILMELHTAADLLTSLSERSRMPGKTKTMDDGRSATHVPPLPVVRGLAGTS